MAPDRNILRSYWRFYESILPFVAAFAIVSIFIGGIVWGFIMFLALAPIIGFLGFSLFYKEQFYFYFNLGLSKFRLIKISFLINLIFGIILIVLYSLFKIFLIGGITN